MEYLVQFEDYREIIKADMAAHKSVRGYQKTLSTAAGCQASYLSKALRGECELTPEHAVGLCKFWNLAPLESYYFLEAVNLSRAGTRPLKEMIRARLRDLRQQLQNIGERLGLPSIETQQADYYSHWYMSAIHVLTSVPEFQEKAALAKRLQLSEQLIDESLRKLTAMGVVEPVGLQKWKPGRGSVHASKGSPYAWLHLANWRQRALQDAQADNQALHFSSIYSLSRKDFETLKSLMMQFIGTCNQTVAASKEETVVGVNLDFFEI